MSTSLLIVQILNGLQLGVLLFLIAAGLTLVFGVMDFINLAHGVQYMLGAYIGAGLAALTGSFWWALLLALPATLACGLSFAPCTTRHRRSWCDSVSTSSRSIGGTRRGSRRGCGLAQRRR